MPAIPLYVLLLMLLVHMRRKMHGIILSLTDAAADVSDADRSGRVQYGHDGPSDGRAWCSQLGWRTKWWADFVDKSLEMINVQLRLCVLLRKKIIISDIPVPSLWFYSSGEKFYKSW